MHRRGSAPRLVSMSDCAAGVARWLRQLLLPNPGTSPHTGAPRGPPRRSANRARGLPSAAFRERPLSGRPGPRPATGALPHGQEVWVWVSGFLGMWILSKDSLSCASRADTSDTTVLAVWRKPPPSLNLPGTPSTLPSGPGCGFLTLEAGPKSLGWPWAAPAQGQRLVTLPLASVVCTDQF